MKMKRLIPTLGIAALTSAWIATPPAASAQVNWVNPGTGDWANPANWSGGAVPDNAGGAWVQGNVNNGGTAVISTLVPNVSEAWAGNNGVAGHIIVTNGGILNADNWLAVSRNGTGNTPLSTLTVTSGGVINKRGDGFNIGEDVNCKGVVTVMGTGRVNITGGWNGIGNGSGEGWLYLQDNAVYNVAGYDWNIGDWGSARGHAYIKDNATLNVSRFWIGKGGTTVGAVWQTGGAIHGLSGGNEWCIGGQETGDAAASGFYSLAAGSLDNVNNFQIGRNGKGMIYQTGGTVTTAGWTSFGRFTGSLGVMWQTGGSFSHTGTGTHLYVAENGRGEFTLAGTGALDCNLSLRLGNPGGVGILNLNAGTASVPNIEQWGGTGYLNLNGGTLKAKVDSAAFIAGLAEVCIYSGNAVIDTAGFDVTVPQAMIAPYGDGVKSIAVADGGTGYMAPPIVQIDANGIGSGATAVAQLDVAAGKVTNIVVTCSGYSYFGAPNVTFVGGGPATAATAGAVTLGAVTSGGLVKNGAGMLTLSGVNTYTGATVVNAGVVTVPTDGAIAGACTVANGASFGVRVASAYSQVSIASLVLASSTAAALEFDLGSFGNPGVVPLNVLGNLTVNGTISVNVGANLLQIGQFPLLQYASKSGSGSFVVGTLPAGVEATIVNNTANKTIDLKVTSVGLPRWDGQVAGGVWDIATTPNWVEMSTGSPTTFNDGAPVTFNDDALGTTTVDLVATVKPANVTVTNTILPYSIIGTGKISGAASLIKQGTNSLTIANTGLNDYSGRTIISGGTLHVTNLANGGLASAIGKSSSSPTNLVLSGGTLSYSGTPVKIDRGYLVQSAIGTIDAQNDLTFSGRMAAGLNGGMRKAGPAKLTYTGVGINELSGGALPAGYSIALGTVVFDGSAGGQTNHNQNELWIGSSFDGNCSLVLTNTTLNVDNWVAVARGNGTVGNTSSLTLYDSVLRSGAFSVGYDGGISGNLAQQFVTLNGNSAITNNGDMNLGESTGSTTDIKFNGNSAIYSAARVHLGWHTGGTATMTLANNSKVVVNAWMSVGNEGGVGTFNMKDASSCWILWDMNVTDVGLGDGRMTLSDSAQLSFGSCFIGKGVGSSGLVTQTGGTAIGRASGNEIQIGFHGAGTWDMTGGSIVASNHWFVVGRWTDGPGVLNISAGTIWHTPVDSWKLLRVGEDGTGVLNLSGSGTIVSTGDAVTIGSNTNGNGTMNLNGGLLQVRRIIGGAGGSTLNFNGTTVRANANANADFISGLTTAYVLVGGAVIDSGAQTIRIAQPLLDGGGNGGLTKLGTGTLALTGGTYTGPTLISAGTLGGEGAIVSATTVAAGAGLSPSSPSLRVGWLTIYNTLTLAPGSTTTMDLDKTEVGGTSDKVVGMTTATYGGTLVLRNRASQLAAGDIFTLFSANTYVGGFTNVVSDTPGQVVTWDTSKLTVDGTVKVLTAAALPVKLTSAVSGGKLNLSWPLSQIGWELQTQVNPLTIGLSTNWSAVAGSTATNQMSFPINPSSGSTFFRLVFP